MKMPTATTEPKPPIPLLTEEEQHLLQQLKHDFPVLAEVYLTFDEEIENRYIITADSYEIKKPTKTEQDIFNLYHKEFVQRQIQLTAAAKYKKQQLYQILATFEDMYKIMKDITHTYPNDTQLHTQRRKELMEPVAKHFAAHQAGPYLTLLHTVKTEEQRAQLQKRHERKERRKMENKWTHPHTAIDRWGRDVEVIDTPLTRNALQEPPGRAYQADLNTWYVYSSDGKNMYEVQRTYSQRLNVLRWTCRCPYYFRIQGQQQHHCKHIQQVYGENRTQHPWIEVAYPIDALLLLDEEAQTQEAVTPTAFKQEVEDIFAAMVDLFPEVWTKTSRA